MGYTLSCAEASLSLEILILTASLAAAAPGKPSSVNPYARTTALSEARVVSEGEDPFTWSPQPVQVPVGATGELILELDIPESCEIYRDKIAVRVLASPGLEVGGATIPVATYHRQIRDHRVGVLTDQAEITLSLTSLGDRIGVQVIVLELTHQGCMGGLCYPEVVQLREALVRIVPAND